MMSDQNPHPGDTRRSQIPVGCPTPPTPLGLDIDRCINAHNKTLLYSGTEAIIKTLHWRRAFVEFSSR